MSSKRARVDIVDDVERGAGVGRSVKLSVCWLERRSGGAGGRGGRLGRGKRLERRRGGL